MSYFTAVITQGSRGWRALDVDVEDVEDLDELAEGLREHALGDQVVLAILEREDQWFALVRVDGDGEPRVFVSDLELSGLSRYADVLAPAGDVDVEDFAHLLGHGPVADPAEGDGWGELEEEVEEPPAEDDDGSAPVDEAALRGRARAAEAAADRALSNGVAAEPAGGGAALDVRVAEDESAGSAESDEEVDDGPVDPTADDLAGEGLTPELDPDLARIASAPEPEPTPRWAGDPTILADLGVEPRELVGTATEEADDPASALAGIGERCGFDGLLDALR